MAANHKVKINGHEFIIRRIPAFEALEMVGDLQRVFGPALAAMAGASDTFNNADRSPVEVSSVMMDAAEALGRQLDGKTLRYLVESLIADETVALRVNGNGEAIRANAAMVGEHCAGAGDLLTLSLEILRFNFQDFFAKAVSHISSAPMFRANTSKGQGQAADTPENPKHDPLDD